MPGTKKMSLKVFWERLEQRLAACSAEELRAIIEGMAQSVQPLAREGFLQKLRPATQPTGAEQPVSGEDLLAEIESLTEDFQDQIERADEWEERYGWDDYHDEDSLGPYEEFVDPLSGLFDRVDGAFDLGDRRLARTAYEKLFAFFDLEDEFGRGVSEYDLHDVDTDEVVARYLRAVYETETAAARPRVLFEKMRGVRSCGVRTRPMLDDLIQIAPEPLPDQDRFLADWDEFLRKQEGPDADAWLREATRLGRGTRGLETLARSEGTKRPRAYLDWLAALEEEGKHRKALTAAREALKTLPGDLPIRAAVADHLCRAAERLRDSKAVREGKWEAFHAKPELMRLVDLWGAAPSGPERTKLMRKASQHVKTYLSQSRERDTSDVRFGSGQFGTDDLEEPASIDTVVLAHAHLFAHQWDAAHQLAAKEKALGWTYGDNPQKLVVPFFLMWLSGKRPAQLPPNLAQLWQGGLTASSARYSWSLPSEDDEEAERTPILEQLKTAYQELLPHKPPSQAKQKVLLSWCLKVARKRTDAIVGNQRRRSYGKAAVLTVACVEVLELRGAPKEANELLQETRDRFPRHRSFQRELSQAVG